MKQKCIDCKKEYEISEIIYQCTCGSLLEVIHDFSKLNISKEMFNLRKGSGVWRFKELILPIDDKYIVSRGEGNTQLYNSKRLEEFTGSKNLLVKHEGENPSGSFKDRGMTVGVSIAKYLGLSQLACASTGNTSASLASYSALGGMDCTVFIPKGKIAYGKLSQALAYGAKTYQLDGDFDDAMKEVKKYCDKNKIYLLNSLNAFRLEGQKSIIFELIWQLNWNPPDWILVPGGNLGNTSAFCKALRELKELSLIEKIPRIAVVQAEYANPLYKSYSNSFAKKEIVKARTIATAINIGDPVNYKKAVAGLAFCNGIVEQVSDQEIMDAKAQVDRAGIGCEPASAASIAGLKKLIERNVIEKNEQVVCILTGNILKDPDATINYHLGKLEGIESNYANPPREFEFETEKKVEKEAREELKQVRVFAPATIANLGPGFDVMGCAIEKIGDIVEAEKIAENKIEIKEIKNINGVKTNLSLNPKENTAGIAANEVLKLLSKRFGIKKGVRLKLYKGIPGGSGLGSSSASAAAGALAVNLLFGNKLSKLELILPCMIAEQAVSGFHADNVAPSLLGGFVLVRKNTPLDVVALGTIDNLYFVVASPAFELLTKDARQKIPETINLKSAIANIGNTSAIVAGILKNDINLFGRGIEDKIIEPVRAELIPGFYDVKKAALDYGALACSISGAGPSVFAVCRDENAAQKIGKAMQNAFLQNKLESKIYIQKVCTRGARRIK